MASVAFDFVRWLQRYPEFQATTDIGKAQGCFNEACLYLDNTDASPIPDASIGGQRELILWMLTAHIAAIYYGVNAEAASMLVGRISQATEGTVSVQADVGVMPNTAAWYQQTKYGMGFWAAVAPLRKFRYVPGRSHPARAPWLIR